MRVMSLVYTMPPKVTFVNQANEISSGESAVTTGTRKSPRIKRPSAHARKASKLPEEMNTDQPEAFEDEFPDEQLTHTYTSSYLRAPKHKPD
ncbi:hypothetical protein TWF788_009847 [Orbilia oligospora]|uniref:Uncharacterized protein n=1 Tax=Orbilia oligospora TaxID=2813651 RepID=A0A7C8Q2R4_ORBOL|nr:hypothetical protein TWF788_009847 [Orbilia oligospora]